MTVETSLHGVAGRLHPGWWPSGGEGPIDERALRELEEITATFDTPILWAATTSARGRLELAMGEALGAGATLQEAAERWAALDVPYEVATARTLLGRALSDCGDLAGATDAFAAAARLFDQIGAQVDARLIDGGVGSILPAGLTDREVEVLRLVAAGMTNSEIATALYPSVKTVSRHLSNIFTKGGVTSRAAATAFAFEHNLVVNRR